VKPLLWFIGGLYGLVGFGSLVPFVMLLLARPPLTRDTVLLGLFSYLFPLFNAIVCGLLAYAFYALRRWGRYMAIVYNGLWLTAGMQGLIYSRLIEKPTVPWTPQATAWLVVVDGWISHQRARPVFDRARTTAHEHLKDVRRAGNGQLAASASLRRYSPGRIPT
jgi:hypothetical protein